MVFGTPITRRPASYNRWPIASEPSPPIVMNASIPTFAEQGDELLGAILVHNRAVRLLHGKVTRISSVGTAEHGAAEEADTADHSSLEDEGSVSVVVLVGEHQSVETVTNPDDLPTASPRAKRRRTDDGVQARRIAATRADGDTHDGGYSTRDRPPVTAARMPRSRADLASDT